MAQNRVVQGADVATVSSVTANNQLPNDDKVFSPAFGTILQQTYSAYAAPLVVTNTASASYSLALVANTTIVVHNFNNVATYALPIPSAGLTITFMNLQIATVGTPSAAGLIISPTAGTVIKYGSYLVAAPGTIQLNNRGLSMTLIGLDSTTWMVQGSVCDQHHKNIQSMGMGTQPMDVTLVGRNTWVAGANDSVTRQYQAAFSLNGYGYVVDGFTVSNVSTVTQYNDSASTWAAKASDSARDYMAAIALNGYGYAIDGNNGSNISTVTQYNDSINTWTAKTGDMARQYQAAFSLNGYGYVVDGSTGSNVSTVTQYNDSASTWAAKASETSTRTNMFSFPLNGYGYVADGYNGSGQISTTTQYNDSLNTWTTKANNPTSVQGPSSFALNGYGYTSGGNTGSPVSNTSQYNDSANAWTAKAGDAVARYSQSAFPLNGYGYVAGGNNGINPTSTVTQYN